MRTPAAVPVIPARRRGSWRAAARVLLGIARVNRARLVLTALGLSLGYVAWTVALLTVVTGIPPRQVDAWWPLWLSPAAWRVDASWGARLDAFFDDPLLGLHGVQGERTWTYAINPHRAVEIVSYSAAAALLLLALWYTVRLRRRTGVREWSAGWGTYAAVSSVGGVTTAGSVGACCGATSVPIVLASLGLGGTAGGLAEALTDPYSALSHAIWGAGIVTFLGLALMLAAKLGPGVADERGRPLPLRMLGHTTTPRRKDDE